MAMLSLHTNKPVTNKQCHLVSVQCYADLRKDVPFGGLDDE